VSLARTVEMLDSDEEDTSMPSDTEEEDDDDPDGMLEADLDKNELIQSHDAEHVGDEFLRVHYSANQLPPSSHRKKRVCMSAVACFGAALPAPLPHYCY